MDLPLHDAGERWTRADHMATSAFKRYVEWRTELLKETMSTMPFWEEGEPKEVAERRINRQVALAIVCDLEYNFHKNKKEIETLTGKSQVYWNFQILGKTVKTDDGRKERREQAITDVFIATMLNKLNAITRPGAPVDIDWRELRERLQWERWRVISVPSLYRLDWERFCETNQIEKGIDYPAPWHVANWAGRYNDELAEGVAVMLGCEWEELKTYEPGRIKRLTIACYGKDGPGRNDMHLKSRRPSILKGLSRRANLHKLIEEQDDARRAAYEEALDVVSRKYAQMMQDLSRQIDKRDEELEKLKRENAEYWLKIGNLEEELRIKNKWGKEMAKRMKQINTLTWHKDIERSLPKD